MKLYIDEGRMSIYEELDPMPEHKTQFALMGMENI